MRAAALFKFSSRSKTSLINRSIFISIGICPSWNRLSLIFFNDIQLPLRRSSTPPQSGIPSMTSLSVQPLRAYRRPLPASESKSPAHNKLSLPQDQALLRGEHWPVERGRDLSDEMQGSSQSDATGMHRLKMPSRSRDPCESRSTSHARPREPCRHRRRDSKPYCFRIDRKSVK